MNAKELTIKLRTEIDNGKYSFGQTIPTEKELSIEYEINRASVKTAVDALVHEGYLRKLRGSGTYVVKNTQEKLQIKFKGFSELLEMRQLRPSSTIIASEIREAGYLVGKKLELNSTDLVFHILRLRSGNNEPISLESTYIPHSLIKDIEKYNFQIYSLYSILAANGFQIDQIFQTVSSAKLRGTKARLLQVEDGITGIHLSIRAKTIDNIPVELTDVLVVSEYADIYTKNFQKGAETKIYAQID